MARPRLPPGKWPAANEEFWRAKIAGNKKRDALVRKKLADAGWQTMTVWECSVRKAPAARFAEVANEIRRWLAISGNPAGRGGRG